MTLVETFAGETDADFRASIDAMLQALNPNHLNWWHPYEVRGTYACRGIRFRDFYCIAGSVQAWVWMHANKGGSRRAIMVPDESVMSFGGVKTVGGGREVPIDKNELTPIPPAA